MTDSPFATPQVAALYAAAAAGDAARARQLAAAGADPNALGAKRQAPLKVAMLQGDRRAFETLLSAGADAAHLGAASDTPLHLAATLADPYWLKTLLARAAGPDAVNVRDRSGQTPLFRALGPQTSANVRLLLDAGADLGARDSAGATALHHAAATAAYDDVLRLLKAGADARATDRFGRTFQPAFFRTREALLNPPARAARDAVRQWLRSHGVAVEDATGG